ncbi:Zn-ribbon domain-containing protein [Archaeoglobus sp.]
MPHRCTRCGKIYEDGDVRILNGCECGNNKFEYIPKERKIKKKEKVVKEIKEEEKIEIVRIISPGCYEINLENAFKRDGIIIALGEEGKYAIHLPSLLKRKKKP